MSSVVIAPYAALTNLPTADKLVLSLHLSFNLLNVHETRKRLPNVYMQYGDQQQNADGSRQG